MPNDKCDWKCADRRVEFHAQVTEMFDAAPMVVVSTNAEGESPGARVPFQPRHGQRLWDD